jgi:hypothetical protein
MRVSTRVGLSVLIAGLSVLASAASIWAQDQEDLRWRDHCLDHSRWSSEARYCEVRLEHLAPGAGPLSVDAGENGGVEVAGDTDNGIVVHELIEAEGSSDDEARATANEVHVVATASDIHAEGPAMRHRHSWAVSYRIEVPRHYDLALTAHNGPVTVDGVTGRLQLDAVNGPISLDRVGGDVHARAENGPLDVTLDGARWDGAGLDAETENGPVDLRVPAHYAAHLETGTVNGPMEIDFPITIQGRFEPRHISIDIGGGGPTVHVATTNGPLSVKTD